MSEKVSVTRIGFGPVDVPDPDNALGRDIATDVKQGDTIEVPENIAKSLCEQVDNWKLAAKPETEAQREAREQSEKEAAEEKAAADKAAKEAIAKVREARKVGN